MTNKSFPDIELLSEKKAACITELSVYWFQRKRWEGGGPPYIKIGRSVRYPKEKLIEWINEHRLCSSTSS